MEKDEGSVRKAILETAVAAIREATRPEQITVRRIVAAAGVNQNAINYYFGSKENLIREAVRMIIVLHYRERGISPGSSGQGVFGNLVRICDFLFAEPIAARLALSSELAVSGAGESLTSETMAALAGLMRAARPGDSPEETAFRVWMMVAVIHQFLLRPEGSQEWLGKDPAEKGARDGLLARLCDLAGVSGQ